MRTVVGVLRGGPSSEYEVSLKSGASVLEALDREAYEPRDIFISRKGDWHLHGVPVAPEKALFGVDVAFNVVHGEYGEDGRIQAVLEALGVPYSGSNALASMLAFNKHETKKMLKKHGIRSPHGVIVHVAEQVDDRERQAIDLFRSMPHPVIVKPVIGGSSVGMTVVHNFHTLARALEHAADISPHVLVEELITGKEASVGVIDNFRGEKTYALLPIEIVPPPGRFFDSEVKYNGTTLERVPGNFSVAEKEKLQEMAKKAHEIVGTSHYSRSDFIVARRGIYLLEINNAQAVGLTKESLLPKALHAVGATLSHFLDHVISLVLKK